MNPADDGKLVANELANTNTNTSARTWPGAWKKNPLTARSRPGQIENSSAKPRKLAPSKSHSRWRAGQGLPGRRLSAGAAGVWGSLNAMPV
ncbi:MAG: hypothetical protein EBQ71_15505 [Betaproteobacteria bacterium]|nr:hypothetical protein [Betaproteobacteria bacterium]